MGTGFEEKKLGGGHKRWPRLPATSSNITSYPHFVLLNLPLGPHSPILGPCLRQDSETCGSFHRPFRMRRRIIQVCRLEAPVLEICELFDPRLHFLWFVRGMVCGPEEEEVEEEEEEVEELDLIKI